MMATTPQEPTLSSFGHNIVSRYFFATRPAFLLATVTACMLGIASAVCSGVTLQPVFGAVTLLLALFTHAAVNVLNDYFDALSGADDANTERLYPFTGGSRFIQNGILTTSQTALFGYALLAIVIMGGLWLTAYAGTDLLWIGGVGLFIGWAYSAEPFKLNSRGLGEVFVLLGFLGVVVGADFVQRQTYAWQPIWIGLPYALLVTNLLLINQFPDRRADMQVGKHHWVVRLPLGQAVYLYPTVAILAAMSLFWSVWKFLPAISILSILPMLFSLQAAKHLMRFSAHPAQLRPAIEWTLMAMLGHGFLLSLILFWSAHD